MISGRFNQVTMPKKNCLNQGKTRIVSTMTRLLAMPVKRPREAGCPSMSMASLPGKCADTSGFA